MCSTADLSYHISTACFLQPDDTVVYAAGAFDLFHILLSMFRISQNLATPVFILFVKMSFCP